MILGDPSPKSAPLVARLRFGLVEDVFYWNVEENIYYTGINELYLDRHVLELELCN